MKCKRLCAWLLSLVMMFSLLPVSAAAVKWYDKHSVTVKYEFKDDSSKSKPDDVKRTIASTEGAIIAFKVKEPGYNHSAKVTSGNAECSIDAGFLHVKHVDADSVITVTYTPKDNVITIDQYYNNGTILAKWGTNITVNGLDIVENNKLEKGAIIDNHDLTAAMEDYRFLTVDGKTYDFSYARQIPYPGESSDIKLAKVWYERDTGEWYYSHLGNTKVPLANKSGVNFCYNTVHTENSEHHQFDQFVKKVPPTCTEQGYTVYQCAYCTKTEMCEYTGPLNHDWKWKHVEGMEEAASKHQQVCQRSGCGEKGTPVNCKFKAVTTGTITTYTCEDCGYHYSKDSSLPTTPVYVYFKTVNTKNELVKVESGVTYNANGSSWATLGKLVTATPVTPEKKNILGAEVKTSSNFVKHDSNKDFDLDWISEWVDLKRDNGAAGYESEAPFGTHVWHLDGQVNVYKLSYDANRPAGVTADVTVPDSAYYLPNWNAPVSTDDPTLQGYDFGGWYREPKCVNEAKEKVAVAKDTVLYAKWTRNSSHGGDDDDKYFFAIQKVDAQDGHALNGAKFELYQLDKNDRIVNRRVTTTRQQSSKNGIALFGVDNKNSYDGIWYYAEVSAPEGYVLDRTEYEINHKDFSDSLSTAVKYADTVRNYRGTTPDLLNDSDHFAYVIGYMDGNVRPYGLISRAETTTIFFRLLKDSVRDGNLLTSNTYTDVADDYWANIAISTMTGLGIVQGRSTTTFDPKAPITRAQFAAICARFDTGKSSGEQTFTDIKGHWAEKYIERAAELGWIKGFEDGTFRPDTYITRAQAMTMINRVLNRIPEEKSDLLPGMNVWPDCNPGDWFYLAIQEATNSHDFEHKAGNYETWTKLMKNPDWTRYEN